MNYSKLAFSDTIKSLQTLYGSRGNYERMETYSNTDGLSPREMQMIENQDSFYMASYGENGFPYIQHRGGPKGFLKVLDDQTLAFLDFAGNMQYISVGNIQEHNKVSLILVNYPTRTRLKIYAEAEVKELNDEPELVKKLDIGEYKHRPERVIIYHIKAFDWNCPQHITPRYTADEIEESLAAQKAYVKTLEEEVERLRAKLKSAS
ncbi:MAG: pyridoxamine 5'-phosphate oxidase family protein [Bacteroidota bacterium]